MRINEMSISRLTRRGNAVNELELLTMASRLNCLYVVEPENALIIDPFVIKDIVFNSKECDKVLLGFKRLITKLNKYDHSPSSVLDAVDIFVSDELKSNCSRLYSNVLLSLKELESYGETIFNVIKEFNDEQLPERLGSQTDVFLNKCHVDKNGDIVSIENGRSLILLTEDYYNCAFYITSKIQQTIREEFNDISLVINNRFGINSFSCRLFSADIKINLADKENEDRYDNIVEYIQSASDTVQFDRDDYYRFVECDEYLPIDGKTNDVSLTLTLNYIRDTVHAVLLLETK